MICWTFSYFLYFLVQGTVSCGTSQNHLELMELIQSQGDDMVGDHSVTSTSTVKAAIKPCSVFVGIKGVSELGNLQIPDDDLEHIKKACSSVTGILDKRNLVMSSDLKKRMRHNFKQSWNGHQAHNDINIVDRDILSNPSMECDDNNVTKHTMHYN